MWPDVSTNDTKNALNALKQPVLHVCVDHAQISILLNTHFNKRRCSTVPYKYCATIIRRDTSKKEIEIVCIILYYFINYYFFIYCRESTIIG